MNRIRRTRLLYALHKWTGLLIGVNVLLFSVTAVYMLAVDLVVPETAGETRVPIDAERALPIQPMFDKLAEHFDGHGFVAERVTYAQAEGDEHELRVELTGPHAHLRFAADPYTGALRLTRGALPEGVGPIGEAAATDPQADNGAPAPAQPAYARLDTFFLQLHSSFVGGVTGTFLVGIVGLVFLVSTLTGWMIYGPFMKAFVFGAIRRNRGVHFKLVDLHKLVGIAALAFNLVMVVTGIGLTLGLFAIRFQVLADLRDIEREVGTITPANPYPNIDTVHKAARSAFPGHAIIRLEYPGPDAIQGDKVFTFFAEPDPFEPGLVPEVGIVTAEATPRAQVYELTWWMEAILLGAPLHTGEFGGKPVYAAYLLLSLASGFLSISGYLMYIVKWRRARALRRGRTLRPATPAASEVKAARELARG